MQVKCINIYVFFLKSCFLMSSFFFMYSLHSAQSKKDFLLMNMVSHHTKTFGKDNLLTQKIIAEERDGWNGVVKAIGEYVKKNTPQLLDQFVILDTISSQLLNSLAIIYGSYIANAISVQNKKAEGTAKLQDNFFDIKNMSLSAISQVIQPLKVKEDDLVKMQNQFVKKGSVKNKDSVGILKNLALFLETTIAKVFLDYKKLQEFVILQRSKGIVQKEDSSGESLLSKKLKSEDINKQGALKRKQEDVSQESLQFKKPKSENTIKKDALKIDEKESSIKKSLPLKKSKAEELKKSIVSLNTRVFDKTNLLIQPLVQKDTAAWNALIKQIGDYVSEHNSALEPQFVSLLEASNALQDVLKHIYISQSSRFLNNTSMVAQGIKQINDTTVNHRVLQDRIFIIKTMVDRLQRHKKIAQNIFENLNKQKKIGALSEPSQVLHLLAGYLNATMQKVFNNYRSLESFAQKPLPQTKAPVMGSS